MPADGLKQYINQIWNDIMNDKDLDIPSQREMLANYRCTEIKNKLLLSYDKEFKDLYKSSLEKDIPNFKNICLELKEKICSEYEKQGSNYDNFNFNVPIQNIPPDNMSDFSDCSLINNLYKLTENSQFQNESFISKASNPINILNNNNLNNTNNK